MFLRSCFARTIRPDDGLGNNTYLLAGDRRSAALIDAGVGDPDIWPTRPRLRRPACAPRTRAGDARPRGSRRGRAGARARLSRRRLREVSRGRTRRRGTRSPGARGRRRRGSRGDESTDALHTPGHSPDHLVFWHEPTRHVFTGDLVILGSSVMIHASRGGNLAQYLASLERLLALEPARLLPAHGPASTIRRRCSRLSRAPAHARAAGARRAARRARAPCRRLPNPSMMVSTPALMPAARENVRAHLEKLEARRASRADDDGRWTSL